MGLIERLFGVVFGSGRNVVAETAQVFRVNAEAQAVRDFGIRDQALQQFGQEFLVERHGVFDRFMDGVNRLPRPALAFGTLGLFIAAMVDPVWFAARMAGIALVPEPLWWLLGAIVSFYFGARHQAKGQAFQRQLVSTMAAVPQVVENIHTIETLRDTKPEITGTVQSASNNPALDHWRASRSS